MRAAKTRGMVLLAATFAMAACQGTASIQDGSVAAGGKTGSGGAAGPGGAAGAPAGSGGAAGSGGLASGGGPGSGGKPGSGGAVSGSGGAGSGSGGAGIGSGGASIGSGGAGSGSGGAGSGGAGSGGAGSGGTTIGCNATSWPASDTKITVTVAGSGGTAAASREFVFALPPSYDSSHAHPVVFAWHGLNGTATQVGGGGTYSWEVYNGYYGQRYRAKQAGIPVIFVSGQGLPVTDGGTDYGWPNTGGRDVAFVREIIKWLDSNLCVDHSRFFSVGFSYGGMFSNTLGCYMGDVFRAIAPLSGGGPGYGAYSPPCVGQVAVWLAHGDADPTVKLTSGEGSRDYWIGRNNCSKTLSPVAVTPSPCVSYQTCDKPVIWCQFSGVHEVQSWEPDGIWGFFLPYLQ